MEQVETSLSLTSLQTEIPTQFLNILFVDSIYVFQQKPLLLLFETLWVSFALLFWRTEIEVKN